MGIEFDVAPRKLSSVRSHIFYAALNAVFDFGSMNSAVGRALIPPIGKLFTINDEYKQ